MNFYLYLKHFPLQDSPLGEGMCKAIHGLASALAAGGQSVTVLCEGTPHGTRHTSEGYQIRCFASSHSDSTFSITRGLAEFIRTAMMPEDLVILNGIFHRSVYVIARHLRRQRVPYIVAPHDPYNPAMFQSKKLLKELYFGWFERRLLQRSIGVQVLDQRHGEWLRQRGIRVPVIEVPNGFEPADVLPEASLHWSQGSPPRIYFLGRFDAYNKGLDLLLAAFAQIQARTGATLTLQGADRGDRSALAQQAHTLGIAPSVTFLDPDYHTPPSVLASQYDIFCIPSRFEGFSLSALEAMLAGRVILISEIAGIAPHVVRSGCGITVQPTIAAITTGLQMLIDRRDRWQEMGLQGRQYALKTFQWREIGQRALAAYQALHPRFSPECRSASSPSVRSLPHCP